MTVAPRLRRSFRARPRAGAGITVLFLAGLVMSAAAGFVGTAVEPATAKPVAADSAPHTGSSQGSAAAERRS